MNISIGKRVAWECGAEAEANSFPSWSKDDRETVAQYYWSEDDSKNWFDISENHRDILLAMYREGERAEKAIKDNI